MVKVLGLRLGLDCVWLVSGYAHVFVLLSVVTVTLPHSLFPPERSALHLELKIMLLRKHFQLHKSDALQLAHWTATAVSAPGGVTCDYGNHPPPEARRR